jgi:Holliday junction resolvase RusA-like endonuclease
MADTYLLRCDGPIVPKARPRGRIGHKSGPKGQKDMAFYMPENYRRWKAEAIRSFQRQAQEIKIPPIDYQIRIYVLLRGKHNRSGDMVDNIPGSICDALVQAEIIPNDSSKWAPSAIYELEWSKAPPIGYVAIAPWLPLRQSSEQLTEILEALSA